MISLHYLLTGFVLGQFCEEDGRIFPNFVDFVRANANKGYYKLLVFLNSFIDLPNEGNNA